MERSVRLSIATKPPFDALRPRVEPAAHIALILLVGLAYRATFIRQGFNATDEGWLQSVGRRITLGQVPYRDFRFAFPPVSAYKEAALQWVLGDAYTILVSRWAFAVEATIGTVLVYLILVRFAGRLPAFLIAVPTIFFSVLYYYFSNYTYDAAIFALLATLCIVHADRASVATLAGVAACLAVLAKPTYAAFVVLLPLMAVAGAWIRQSIREDPPQALRGFCRTWPYFIAGAVITFLLVLGYFGIEGAGRSYVEQAFLEIQGASARPFGFAIWQDLPTVFTSREVKLFALVFVLLVVAAVGVVARLRWLPTAAIAAGLAYYGLEYIRADAGFIPMAMGLLLVINATALAVAVTVRLPRISSKGRANQLAQLLPPPELIVIALAMQYLAQFTFSGVIYSYIGSYLSVPVATWTLYALGKPDGSYDTALAAIPAVAFGAWLAIASTNFVHNHVYFDQSRNALTAQFQTAKLRGISSTPVNVHRVDGVVELIDAYSKPGDPILALPDFACIYYLTDRVNPTNQDWYLTSDARFVTPSEVQTALGELEADPPKVVVVQTVTEFDSQRTYRPDLVVNWSTSPLRPIHDYVLAHYVVVGTVGDIAVMVPQS